MDQLGIVLTGDVRVHASMFTWIFPADVRWRQIRHCDIPRVID